jgi:hypothetical protein
LMGAVTLATPHLNATLGDATCSRRRFVGPREWPWSWCSSRCYFFRWWPPSWPYASTTMPALSVPSPWVPTLVQSGKVRHRVRAKSGSALQHGLAPNSSWSLQSSPASCCRPLGRRRIAGCGGAVGFRQRFKTTTSPTCAGAAPIAGEPGLLSTDCETCDPVSLSASRPSAASRP